LTEKPKLEDETPLETFKRSGFKVDTTTKGSPIIFAGKQLPSKLQKSVKK
jgi:hypothetical protein